MGDNFRSEKKVDTETGHALTTQARHTSGHRPRTALELGSEDSRRNGADTHGRFGVIHALRGEDPRRRWVVYAINIFFFLSFSSAHNFPVTTDGTARGVSAR